jgi:phenylacetate-coenzyme A ligase PaaK-like adenylate-forming protein
VSSKLDGRKLGNTFMQHKLTVLPITPSLFRRVGNGLQSANLFNPEYSSLKVICFGGEKCVSEEELTSLIGTDMNNSLRAILNVYGVTEVSCWASYCNINLYEEGSVSIARPMRETNVTIYFDKIPENFSGRDVGEIVIGKTILECFED